MFEDVTSVFTRHYAHDLTKTELDQFNRALTRPTSHLLDKIIKPSAYVPAHRRYMGIESTTQVDGRSHFNVQRIVQSTDPVAWMAASYFTNPLTIASPDDEHFNHPSRRIAVGPHHILTIEFDQGGLPFLKEQLSWLRSSANPLDCEIGRFVRHLRDTYLDFAGLSVVYSGSKSLHYHFVFHTHLLTETCAVTSPRHGFQKTWKSIYAEMKEALPIPDDVAADGSLRMAETYRRLPNGWRLINKDHPFNVPHGEIVPQVVLWESYSDRVSTKASASVFDPGEFTRDINYEEIERRAAREAESTIPAYAQLNYAEDKMRAIFPGDTVWPMFDRFSNHSGEFRAYFFNSITDKRATSFMGLAYPVVHVQGSGADLLTNDPTDTMATLMPRLPRSLGEMLQHWSREYDAIHSPLSTFMEPAPGGRTRTPAEEAFAEAAVDASSAVEGIGSILTSMVLNVPDDRSATLLSAPEGVSKSRSLFATTPDAIRALHDAARPLLAMYAFATYELAAEKAAEFNLTHGQHPRNRHYRAIVLESFTRLYMRFCSEREIRPFTITSAARAGHASLMDAIRANQPEVMADFRAYHADLQRQLQTGRERPANAIVFTVHDVAQEWFKSSNTRLMFAPAYWEEGDAQRRHVLCREATTLGLLVHDEIKPADLLVLETAAVLEWMSAYRLAHPRDHKAESLATRYDAFADFNALSPFPSGKGFEHCDRLMAEKAWTTIQSGQTDEYGLGDRTDLFSRQHDQPWFYAVRDWTGAAHQTVVLTTETVPTLIARRLGWNVIELDTPKLRRDIVETTAERGITATNLVTLVTDARTTYEAQNGRPLRVISNRVAEVTGTKTHAAAKGSNDFMGEAVLQTMTMMSPEQYGEYQALNTFLDRTDCVRLRHIDEFNQTAGRNLGFRYRSGAEHMLLINPTLFRSLIPLLNHARYTMRQNFTQKMNKTARTNAKAAPPTRAVDMARLRALLQKGTR